jgi:hypothetical protein
VNREGTSTVARKVSTTTGPTPGVVISLRQAWILLFATSQTHSAVRPIHTAASNATDFMALTRTNGEQ